MPDAPGRYRGFLQRSIFLKLFLIYAVTTVALIVALSWYSRMVLRHDETFKQTRSRMMAHHLTALIEELGHPPEPERAARLSQDLGIQIRVEGAGGSWATDAALPPSHQLTVHHSRSDLDMQVGRYRGRRVMIMDHGDTRFLFFFPEPPELNVESAIVIVGLIALILAASYLLVRWLFRPLDWLAQGVVQLAEGNLAHRVPVRSGDQLGQLAGALNDMASRIREMLRARDRLLLDVSHELRSPLTRIKVALEFVRDEPTKERIQQDIRDLEAMITELLESERLNSTYGGVTLSEQDLVPLVRGLVDTYAADQCRVQLSAAPAGVRVHLDPNRVLVALRNVIDNAVKHSPPERGPVEVRIETAGDWIRVSVRDQGPGVPLDEQALIFEPFYRVDKSRTRTTGGYGLGLSLAKKIMAAHGGDILLTSEPGEGSVFVLVFPLSKDAEAGAAV